MPKHWKTPPGFQRTWTTLALCLALSSPPVSAQSVDGQPIPAQGPAGALVEIVEVGDFECPYCAKAQASLKQVMEAYPTLVRRVFIHQPLPFHDQALQTALASVVAQQQGKFWRVADTFFVEQGDLSTHHTRQVALRNNIELAALTEGLKSPEVQAFVEANKQVALALGVSGTPVFFVNGTMIRGAKPFSSFKKIIDIEIALAGKAPMTPEGAAAHRQARTKTNNADLYAYLYGGKAAPEADDEATRSRSGGTSGSDDEPRYRATIRVDDPFRGDREKALVTVVSFVGYQCKYSRGLMGALSDIQAEYGEEVGLVLKHLPLSIHPLGAEAAVTALCAHQQGKFWEVNDALFSDSQMSASAVLNKALSQGLDMVALKTCTDAGEVRQQLREDGILAQTVGARGTPTTFVNGRQLVGAVPTEDLKAIVEAELTRVRASIADGAAVADLYPALMTGAQVLEPLEERVVTLDMERSPTRGSATSPIQLVVFADYQCPYCAKLEPTLQQVYQRYAGRVAVTVKHFPLNFHREARPAAEAAHCAQEQDKFWPMHDGLNARFATLNLKVIEEVALNIGVDMTRYAACLKDPETARAIDQDIMEGKRSGLMGTPTLLFNGRRYDLSFGASADDLSQTIDRLLGELPPAR